MKRKALLIGNNHGLPGVKIDLKKFEAFLLSDIGGGWLASEIEVISNPSKSHLANRIDAAKLQKHDYTIVLFSGHGGHARRTILELNQYGESIEDIQLHEISTRQITIHDCCRSITQPIFESTPARSAEAMSRKLHSDVRQRYERRIMQATPQQVKLYSCSIGQVAYDTKDGGIYTSNLLASARAITGYQLDKTIGVAHQESIEPTQRLSKEIGGTEQTPDAVIPKCLSQHQLILSIHP
jgi:Caspase domain